MAYTRVNWEDLPSTNAPINATNLNKMDLGIFNLDNNKADITYVDDYTDGTKPMGSIVVDDVSGKNLYDGLYEIGTYSDTTGEKESSSNTYRSTNASQVKPNTQYVFSINSTAVSVNLKILYYSSNGNFLSSETITNGEFTTPATCYQIRWRSSALKSAYPSGLTNVQIELGTTATTYTPYKKFDNTGYVLYQDAGNGNNGTVNLSDSLNNYSCYEIFYRRSTSASNAGFSSAKFDSQGLISITGSFTGTTNTYIHMTSYTASDTSITPSNYASVQWVNSTGTSTFITSTNYIYITKVVGYK